MNPYSIMILVFAALYVIMQTGGMIALCSAVERQKKFKVNMNGALFQVIPLFLAAAAVEFFFY